MGIELNGEELTRGGRKDIQSTRRNQYHQKKMQEKSYLRAVLESREVLAPRVKRLVFNVSNVQNGPGASKSQSLSCNAEMGLSPAEFYQVDSFSYCRCHFGICHSNVFECLMFRMSF